VGERCRQRERSGVSLNVDSGRSLRKRVPRSSHAYWVAGKDRPSSVDVITSQNTDRLQWLVPVRHWRMAQSPFTYYRGAAKLMALDLAETLTTGIHAQICGDAHLSNFGVYGSPDRALVFDINDFDETLSGPWEWDIKRLAASFAIAARQNEFDDAEETDLAVASAAAYRKAMRRFAEMRYLDAWYARIETKDLVDAFRDDLTKKERKSSKRFIEKAKSRDSLHALGKLAESVDGGNRIISQPPLIIPIRDLEEMAELTELNSAIRDAFAAYLDSVPDHLEVWTWQSRPWVSAASAHAATSCCCRARIRTIHCSCRSRKPHGQCWRIISPTAVTPRRGVAWWRASDSCRPPATASLVGPNQISPDISITGVSSRT